MIEDLQLYIITSENHLVKEIKIRDLLLIGGSEHITKTFKILSSDPTYKHKKKIEFDLDPLEKIRIEIEFDLGGSTFDFVKHCQLTHIQAKVKYKPRYPM